MSDELPQAQFNGWARVEVMGHQTHIGYVRTEAYGAAVLFRVDTPEMPEREHVLQSPDWSEGDRGEWLRAGTKVRREARPGVSVLIGAGSIYRIVPCTEEAALKAIETTHRAKLRVVELPPDRALAAGASAEDDFDTDDGDDDAEPDDDLPVGVG